MLLLALSLWALRWRRNFQSGQYDRYVALPISASDIKKKKCASS